MSMELVRKLTIAGLLLGGGLAQARPDDDVKRGHEGHERMQIREMNQKVDHQAAMPRLDRSHGADVDKNIGKPDHTMYERNNRPQIKTEVTLRADHGDQRAPDMIQDSNKGSKNSSPMTRNERSEIGTPDKRMYEGNNRPQIKTEVMLRASHGDQRAPDMMSDNQGSSAAGKKVDGATGVKTHANHYQKSSERPGITTAQEATALSPAAKQYFQKVQGLKLGNTSEKSADVEDKSF
jgi:hypothetical protein